MDVTTLRKVPELVIPMPSRRLTNYDFAGDIRIDGDLPAGVRVRAGGDVRVFGSVTGGEIHADGSIEITGSVRVHSRLEATGDIEFQSGQRSHVRCAGNLRVAGELAYCETEVGGVAAIGGRVFGGHLVADRGLHALALGTRTAPRTQVMVVPEWHRTARIAELDAEIRRSESRLALIRDAAERVTSPREFNYLHGVETEVERAARSLRLERDALEQATRLSVAPAVVVEQGVFPGVELQVQEATLAVRSLLPPGRFFESHGQIMAVREAS
ncbi:MAG: DUF342 domain-containing protein [Candidatus Sericytochromatia bacterium]|nr:DUF342 domain-containing protein [Candidatus Tanganyikabacteria bacterium]